MRIFITGGTGLVGTAAVKALVTAGHSVSALARSQESADKLSALGATPVSGNLLEPDAWADTALDHEAIIHAAATFETDMGQVDAKMISLLCEKVSTKAPEEKIRFIYTGGCWLYPESPVIPLTERHVLDPLPEFEWMLDSIEQVHSTPNFQLTVIHPALVTCKGRGLIADYANELKEDGKITVISSTQIHFPFIQADDLGDLYLKAVEHGGDGLLLNACAFKSAPVDEITELVAKECNLPLKVETISTQNAQEQRGNWVAGYARSQRMEADRAKDLLGWEPKITDIESIVKDSLS